MRIAIIGGGAAAVGLLDALAMGEREGAEVVVFEPSAQLWRGRPYGPELDSVLVNAPPAIMSIRGCDPGHYASWLGAERAADHLDELLGQPLVPRALYGEYLADTAEGALARLRGRGWRTRVVASQVVGVARASWGGEAARASSDGQPARASWDGEAARASSDGQPARASWDGEAGRAGGDPRPAPGATDGRGAGAESRLVLRTADGHEHVADQVVVCVGGGTPQDHYGLSGAPGYIGDPYPLAYTLDGVPGEADVAVIGSGLTAVDVVVSLAARGHTGRIALVSRTGMLPAVWQRPLGHRRRHLTVERVEALRREHGAVTLDDLVGLLRAELDEVGEDLAGFARELLSAENSARTVVSAEAFARTVVSAEAFARTVVSAEAFARTVVSAEDSARTAVSAENSAQGSLPVSSEPSVERLRRQLAAVGDPAIARRVLQEAAHVVGPFAWRLLSEPDRERLRRHARLAISVASPMVPVNAATLLRLFDSGQLSVVAGVRKIEAVTGGFRVPRARGEAVAGGFRVRGDGEELEVDVAVNAVNPPPQAVPGTAEPLVTALLADGLAALHPSGGLVPADPRLHVLGDLAGGGSFITSSIPGLAAQATRIAEGLTAWG
ncbi:FAD/NAD(P)-binding protein [Nonomuraea sp. PA05]|uniref:FAD/NAD(P)-binding protein n=1 Tax=Nonomuraea sp. PA05 TaxID=2604466 RepID=UPI0021CC8E68|nr:FAD/NAD(P)-binding protein [Nonomuraea sp. PA05]